MTTTDPAALLALAEQWRAEAERHTTHGDCYRVGQGWGLGQAADELEAAMALVAPQEPLQARNYEVLYHELLYAVAHKHQGESRHQTALRYICEREQPSVASGCNAPPAPTRATQTTKLPKSGELRDIAILGGEPSL